MGRIAHLEMKSNAKRGERVQVPWIIRSLRCVSRHKYFVAVFVFYFSFRFWFLFCCFFSCRRRVFRFSIRQIGSKCRLARFCWSFSIYIYIFIDGIRGTKYSEKVHKSLIGFYFYIIHRIVDCGAFYLSAEFSFWRSGVRFLLEGLLELKPPLTLHKPYLSDAGILGESECLELANVGQLS